MAQKYTCQKLGKVQLFPISCRSLTSERWENIREKRKRFMASDYFKLFFT
jgi:hypothetical protein